MEAGWSLGERGAPAEMPRWPGAAEGRPGRLLRKDTAEDDKGGNGVPGSTREMRREEGR